jgi:hypothetical protein
MDHLRRGGARIRLRSVRNPDAAPHRASGAYVPGASEAGHAPVQPLGRGYVLRPQRRRRYLRPDRRLFDRPLRAKARPSLEHPALQRLSLRSRLFDFSRATALLSRYNANRGIR